MKDSLLLVGGGGHCRACIDVIEQEGRFVIAGIVDLPNNIHRSVLGYPVIGSDSDLPQLIRKYTNVLIALGQIKSSAKRIELFDYLKRHGARFPVIRSPLAYISPHSRVAEGTIVMHCALINAGASVGRNCIINTKALVEHDALVEDHCHISTGAIINGGVRVEVGSFIGSNSTAKESISVGEHSVVGCGAVIIKPVCRRTLLRALESSSLQMDSE